MHKLLLLSLCLLISSGAFSQTLKTFTPGEAAKASEVNGNFNLLLERISQLENDGNTLASCNTYESTASGIVECPQGSTMTGGGFAFADPSGSVSASRPLNNGWQCLWDDGSIDPALGTSTCHVRCCGAPAPDLGLGQYCSSNYCIQVLDPNSGDPVGDYVIYLMALAPNEFRKFPMDVDETFNFPPDNIGVVSLLIRWQDQDYHVTNVDESCYNGGAEASDCISEWTNVDVLEQAMLSGEIEVAPGPLNILDEFQIVNNQNIPIRFQTTLDQGYVAAEAKLEANAYTVYRVEDGTGNREGGSCQELLLGELVSVAGVLGSETTNVSINAMSLTEDPATWAVSSWNGSAFRILVCNDSPVGTYKVGFTARDGKGGKSFLGYVDVTILEETRPGGDVVF